MTYETNSFSWQVRLVAQRLHQGLEYWFSQLDVDPPQVPTWAWPAALGRGLFWVSVVGLSLWLGWLLGRALIGYWQRRQLSTPAQATISVAAHSARYWWQQAQAQAQAGHYAEACRALYLAALQRLDETQTLLQDPSRTDGEYLLGLAQIEAQQRSLAGTGFQLSRPYQLLIRTHERIIFGNAVITAESFQRCQRAYEEIQP